MNKKKCTYTAVYCMYKDENEKVREIDGWMDEGGWEGRPKAHARLGLHKWQSRMYVCIRMYVCMYRWMYVMYVCT